MLRMIVIGVVGGVTIWDGLDTGMVYTNRTEFRLPAAPRKLLARS